MNTFRRSLASGLIAVLGMLSAAPALADARAEVTAAFQAAMQASSYRLQIVVENKRGPIRSQMDVQLPDRFHMKADEAEFIIIPGGTWINAAGRWMKVPVDMSKQMQGYRLQDVGEASARLETVEKLGNETINGCPSTLYRYASTSKFAGRSSNDEVELAICDTSGKPIRLRSTPKGKGDAVVIHYDFDAAVNISAPQ